MTQVAPIRLTFNPHVLWFDSRGIEARKGDAVVVSTARGVEFGVLADDIFEASNEQISQLKSALKPVLRVASPADIERAEELRRKSEEALLVFKRLAAEEKAEMSPVSVEYLFDGDKAVFYFESDERVDFRDLVKKLAAQFHVRIDMRQIGVRDQARLVGGLGHCGQELCCKRLGGDFDLVSIRMAKEQDLSLNPQKISGVCGRLMCCLRYEYEAYKDFKGRAPKVNATIETPDGPAKVSALDVPREVVTLHREGEKDVKVPLAGFEPPCEGARPCAVCKDAWEEATTQAQRPAEALGTFLTSQFTGSDKLAAAGQVRHVEGARKQKAGADTGRKPRRRGGSKGGQPEGSVKTTSFSSVGTRKSKANGRAAAEIQPAVPARTPRKRRSVSVESGEGAQGASVVRERRDAPAAKPLAAAGAVRPGQHSSALRNAAAPAARSHADDAADEKALAGKGSSHKRGSRGGRGRGKRADGAAAAASVNAAAPTNGRAAEGASVASQPRRKKQGGAGAETASRTQAASRSQAAAAKAPAGADAAAQPQRRSRHRNHKAGGASEAQGGAQREA